MNTNIKLIKTHRQFSEAFKKQIVKDFESGQLSMSQIERLHGISNKSIYKWIYKFSTFNEQGYRILEMKRSSTSIFKELKQSLF
jgi:transposase-like protein